MNISRLRLRDLTLAAAGSYAFKLPKNVLGKRCVEVVRYDERSRSETERTGIDHRSRDRTQLRNHAFVLGHQEMFPSFNSVQESEEVPLEFLYAHGIHEVIVSQPQ